MENAIEALKIASGVLMFVLALTISISCFSQANESITSIVNMSDKDTKILYDNIRPSDNLTRTVGIETIIPTMYKAYDSDSLEIYFEDSKGEPMPIYYEIDSYGNRVKDGEKDKIVSYIGTKIETSYPDSETQIKHLDMVLAGSNRYKDVDENMVKKYEKGFYQFGANDSFFDYIKGKKFEEKLGEYYESEGSTSTQTKIRKIIYKEIAN